MSEEKKSPLKVAVVGGTGAEGSGLAYRWSRAGCSVVVGSRDVARAQACAAELATLPGVGDLRGASNEDAVDAADIVVLTVPFSAQQSTALHLKDGLRGKILVDVTVPLKPPKVDRVSLPNGESAVAAIQAALPETRVVSACQNVSAHHLKDPHHQIDCDVLICGDDVQACETVVGLVQLAGLRGIHVGPVANSVAAEAMTSLLIFINKKYKVKGSGIRITGLPA